MAQQGKRKNKHQEISSEPFEQQRFTFQGKDFVSLISADGGHSCRVLYKSCLKVEKNKTQLRGIKSSKKQNGNTVTKESSRGVGVRGNTMTEKQL